MSEPKASRPHIPGYGIAESSEGLLPWSWAEERLVASHNYWVAVMRAGGGPHLTPVWGVWHEGALWWSTGGGVKMRALAADPRCVISTESAEEAVIVEGEASRDGDRAVLREVIRSYNEKYNWNFEPEQEGFYIVRPRVVFGFIEHANQFGRTATRWTFG
jgi:hypothetical protein